MKLLVIHNESLKEVKVISGEFVTPFSHLLSDHLFDVCMVACILNINPLLGVSLVLHHILGYIWNGGRLGLKRGEGWPEYYIKHPSPGLASNHRLEAFVIHLLQ